MTCLPPPLMTSEPGSFARQTIEERKPAILADVLTSPAYEDEVRRALLDLREEIRCRPVAPPPPGVPLRSDWLAQWERWRGRTWLEVPWYFAESYFYVRLLKAIGYFAGRHGDPFASQKANLLEQSHGLLGSLAETETRLQGLPEEAAFAALVRRSLWGNRVDLSNVAIAERHRRDPSHLDQTDIVVDDTDAACQHLREGPGRQVTILCDNSGPELLADLHLSAWMLARLVDQVVLEVKPQPFFVSDAMREEVRATIGLLAGASQPEASQVGRSLVQALDDGNLIVRDHPFWSGPLHYTALPPDLSARLAASDLVISKGDVNYRRFLEDRHWPFQTPIGEVITSFPTDVLLLRTFKGELATGLSKAQVERLEAEDPHWLTSGRQGVAQLARRSAP